MGLTYRDDEGTIYAAHAGLGGANFYVMKTKNGEGWHRVKSPVCPERASIEEAQADLDAWADKKGLRPVEDLTGEYAKAKKPDDNQWVVELIDTRSIRPSPVNRKGLTTGDEETIELSKNLREIGLIQPVTVRPVDGGYELVCGERRWLAYQVNAGFAPGWDRIPAYVRTIDDQRAHELTVVENLQRKNLTPLEEAAGIDVLLAGGRGLVEIADALGKPVGWVARRVKLRDLTEKWKTAIADHEHGYSLWPVTHLEAVARYCQEVQDEIYALYDSRNRREISLKELQKELGRFMLALSGALWPKDQPGPGNDKTCATCGERSGCQPELFDDIGGVKRNDRCLNRACYGKKLEAFLIAREKELRKQHPDLKIINKADVNDGFIPSGSELSKKALQEKWKYSKVKEDSQGAFPALVIDGPGTGKIEWWALDRGFQTITETRYDENGEKMPKTLTERRMALNKRRDVRLLERAKKILESEMEKPSRCHVLGTETMLHAIRLYRTEAHDSAMSDDARNAIITEAHDRYLQGKAEQTLRPLIEDVFVMVCGTWIDNIRGYLNNNEPSMRWSEFVYMLFGMNITAACAEIAEEIPEPKSWAGLNEDGTPKTKAAEAG